MVNRDGASESNGVVGSIVGAVRDFFKSVLGLLTGKADLNGKILLFDNDEMLLVWEHELREKRLKKEEDAWKRFEKQFGRGAPEVTDAFLKWQEGLYAYIEQEKDRFLRQRPGTQEALTDLLRAGAKTIVVTKGAKPYTHKCFNLVDMAECISDIYSPDPGKRDKRFVDAVIDYGKTTSKTCLADTLVVGHDPEKDMGWDLVPSKGLANDGNAPVFVMFTALKFIGDVPDPLDALPEITNFLLRKGKGDFLQGFKSITKPEQAKTKNYTFKIALYHNPKRNDKARIPIIHEIRRRR